MKRSHWVLALTSALVTLMVAPVASAETPGKVDVCHGPADASSDWNLIAVSVRSLEQHIEHGDGLPLGDVPGSDGELTFDESCGVVPGDPGDPGDPPDSETVFAIAYSDLDQDGTYNPASDALIAKFVDGPSPFDDGIPGEGDLVVTDRYPTDITLGSLGDFGLTEHVVTGSSLTGARCMASASTDSFIWEKSTTVEGYEERAGSGELSFFRDSIATGGSDVVVAVTTSPSQPTTAVSTFAMDDAEDAFLEVELNCSG